MKRAFVLTTAISLVIGCGIAFNTWNSEPRTQKNISDVSITNYYSPPSERVNCVNTELNACKQTTRLPTWLQKRRDTIAKAQIVRNAQYNSEVSESAYTGLFAAVLVFMLAIASIVGIHRRHHIFRFVRENLNRPGSRSQA
jgi:hypothetical protein